jgi:glutamine synthetase
MATASAADILKTIKDKEISSSTSASPTPRAGAARVGAGEVVGNNQFEDGHAFDGSSIAGWKGIEASDMLLMPDPSTAYIDPFMDETTLNITCDVVEPSDGKGYERDPRSLAKRAESYSSRRGSATSRTSVRSPSSSSSTRSMVGRHVGQLLQDLQL